MRISDWSSDVCSSDLSHYRRRRSALQRPDDRRKIVAALVLRNEGFVEFARPGPHRAIRIDARRRLYRDAQILEHQRRGKAALVIIVGGDRRADAGKRRSDEHTSELKSLMRIPYAV